MDVYIFVLCMNIEWDFLLHTSTKGSLIQYSYIEQIFTSIQLKTLTLI